MNPKPRTILYVDDDPDDRELLSELLRTEEPGVDVILAPDGIRAIEYLNATNSGAAERPALIILDINMPFIDGTELFRQLRSDDRFRNIPVLMYSSSENPSDRQHFQCQGAMFISKPDTLAYMRSIARVMLAQAV
ncbi:MAG: response regulator [Chitinophagaceae bacterium]|nr:MAG: response regulator [Chitinophagaceae bacterium]